MYRLFAWLAIGTLSFICFAQAQEDGYELHEWGLFSVPRNCEYAQQDMRSEWASFPEFFYTSWPIQNLPKMTVECCWKPVIFFHSAKPQQSLSLTVTFTEGRPLICWPAPGRSGDKAKWNEVGFQLQLLSRDPQALELCGAPPPPEVKKGHWIEDLRAVKSNRILASNGARMDQEHFVYYDGILKVGSEVRVQREGASIILQTESNHELHDLMVVEWNKDRCRIAKSWTPKVDAGKQTTKLEMKDAGDGSGAYKTLATLKEQLTSRLEAAGLNADEARSFVAVWDKGLFHRDGISLFYRVKQETYDAWLPLKAVPKPSRTVRVGIVLHSHLESEVDPSVTELIEKLGAEDFADRESARREILRIGGVALPALRRALQNENLEIQQGAKALLHALDVEPAIHEKDAEPLQLQYTSR